MSLQTTSTLNLRSGSKISSAITLDGKGPLSIQPILTNVEGSPTYTVEVSNDSDVNTFTPYNTLSTNVDITDSIIITYNGIPWNYMRFVVTSTLTDVGTIVFNVKTVD